MDSLRALLIRIGVKLGCPCIISITCLRALLIRIGVKPEPCGLCSGSSLRALLIRIGVKLHYPAELYGKFESLVNSDRCQTRERLQTFDQRFESLVNSDRCQTIYI